MSLNRIVLYVAVAEFAALGFFVGWKKAMATPPSGISGALGVTYDEACNVARANVNGNVVNLSLDAPTSSGWVVTGPAEISAGTVQIVGNNTKIPIVARGGWVNLSVDCISHAHML